MRTSWSSWSFHTQPEHVQFSDKRREHNQYKNIPRNLISNNLISLDWHNASFKNENLKNALIFFLNYTFQSKMTVFLKSDRTEPVRR